MGHSQPKHFQKILSKALFAAMYGASGWTEKLPHNLESTEMWFPLGSLNLDHLGQVSVEQAGMWPLPLTQHRWCSGEEKEPQAEECSSSCPANVLCPQLGQAGRAAPRGTQSSPGSPWALEGDNTPASTVLFGTIETTLEGMQQQQAHPCPPAALAVPSI